MIVIRKWTVAVIIVILIVNLILLSLFLTVSFPYDSFSVKVYPPLNDPVFRGNYDMQSDICMVSAWSGADIQSHHPLFFHTADRNSTSKLYFVHEGIKNVELLSSQYPNINFVNLHNIAQYTAHKMCRFYKIAKDPLQCNRLIDALVNADNFVGGAAVAQYRVMFGYAFSDFIGPGSCKSWAFIDSDMMLGDIESHIKLNQYFWDSDVITMHPVFRWDSIYTAGQFTAQILTKRPWLILGSTKVENSAL